MEESERSQFTRAGEIANQRLIDAAIDPERYEDGTAFIPADTPEFRPMLIAAVAEHRPLAIVWPDGREVVASREAGAIASFVGMLLEFLLSRRRRSKSHRRGMPEIDGGSVSLPADYRVEIRERDKIAVG